MSAALLQSTPLRASDPMCSHHGLSAVCWLSHQAGLSAHCWALAWLHQVTEAEATRPHQPEAFRFDSD